MQHNPHNKICQHHKEPHRQSLKRNLPSTTPPPSSDHPPGRNQTLSCWLQYSPPTLQRNFFSRPSSRTKIKLFPPWMLMQTPHKHSSRQTTRYRPPKHPHLIDALNNTCPSKKKPHHTPEMNCQSLPWNPSPCANTALQVTASDYGNQ